MLDDNRKRLVSGNRPWEVEATSELLLREVGEVVGCPTTSKAVSCLWAEVFVPSARTDLHTDFTSPSFLVE